MTTRIDILHFRSWCDAREKNEDRQGRHRDSVHALHTKSVGWHNRALLQRAVERTLHILLIVLLSYLHAGDETGMPRYRKYSSERMNHAGCAFQ